MPQGIVDTLVTSRHYKFHMLCYCGVSVTVIKPKVIVYSAKFPCSITQTFHASLRIPIRNFKDRQ